MLPYRKGENIIMSMQITQLSNLVELIEDRTISVENVRCETTMSSDTKETNYVETTDFVESLQYLNEAKLFKNGISFFYEWINFYLIIKTEIRSLYTKETYIVTCTLRDGILASDVGAKLRESDLSKINKKMVV